jgi:hypothetical protein
MSHDTVVGQLLYQARSGDASPTSAPGRRLVTKAAHRGADPIWVMPRCRRRSLTAILQDRSQRLTDPISTRPGPGAEGLQVLWAAMMLSPRSDSNRRPSDYESKRTRPAGVSQAGSGCSRQRGRLLSAFLTCGVTAGGMTKRMTSRVTAEQRTVSTDGCMAGRSDHRWVVAVRSPGCCSPGSGGAGCGTGISSVPVVGSGLRRPR